MKKLLVIITGLTIISSCYISAPVYFNRPIGKPATEFDESIQGVYLDIDDVVEYFENSFGKKLESIGDSTLIASTKERFMEIIESALNPSETLDTSSAESSQKDFPDKDHASNDTGAASDPNKLEEPLPEKTGDSLRINFNEPIHQVISNSKTTYLDRAEFYVYVLSQSKLQIITIDSAFNINSSSLIELSDTLKLTTVADRYFLNSKTPLGWEIIQIQELDGILIFKAMGTKINYTDASALDLDSLEVSVSNYYRNLKPIQENNGEVIGFKARTNRLKILKTFDIKEEPWYRLVSYPFFEG